MSHDGNSHNTMEDPCLTSNQEHEACACKDRGRHHSGKEGSGRRKQLRRIHGLCGIWFAGFLLMHLGVGSLGHWPVCFDHAAQYLRSLAETAPGLEFVLILLPLLVMIVTGVRLIGRDWLSMVEKPNRGGKVRYFLQRLTAVIILGFVLLHVGTYGPVALLNKYDPHHPFASTRAGITQLIPHGSAVEGLNILVILVYGFGIIAVSYHVANGLAVAAYIWPSIAGRASDARWVVFSMACGLIFLVIGLSAWLAFI